MPSIDGDNLIFTLDSAVTELDFETDIYSPWKEWTLTGDNLKYEAAFRLVTSEVLSSSVNSGAYFFFQNQSGWRFRGPEEDITISITGNVALEDPSLPAVIPTIGAYTTLILGLQPVTQNVDQIIAAQEIQVRNLQQLTESQRPTHSAFGDVYYWDPINGSDTNDGSTKALAFATFAAAHAAAASHNDDVIFAISGAPSGDTVTTETLVISKSHIYLRGPGHTFQLIPSASGQATISITGDGVEVDSLHVETAAGGSDNAIETTGKETSVSDCYVPVATLHGIDFKGAAANCHAVKNSILGVSGHGIHVEATGNDHELSSNRVIRCGKGVHLATGAGADIVLNDNVLVDNTGEGLLIESGVTGAIVRANNTIQSNTGGDIDDSGTDTIIEDTATDVWDVALAAVQSAGSVGEAIQLILDLSRKPGLSRYR